MKWGSSRRRAAAALAGAGMVATVAALMSSSARATVPGANGLIVYQARVGQHVQLFTVRADGTDVQQLTAFADSDGVSASWSPDGASLVFEHGFDDHVQIETMNADGSEGATLVSGWVFQPSFSPNGHEIVFDRFDPETGRDGLVLMNAHGRGQRQVTLNDPAGPGECRCDGSPVFSPDGKRIAFVRTIDELTTAVFVVDTNGRRLTQVTPWELGVSAKLDWAPDGSRIVVSTPQAERPGSTSNVITVRPDGSGLTQLTHETTPGVHDLADGFSPDGSKIIFARTVDGGAFQVYAMNADGSGAAQLTHGVDAHWASWGTQP